MSDKPEFNEEEFQAQMNAFFERADAIINLANSQLGPQSHAGQVAASLNYAAARFAVSAATIGFVKGSDYAKEKQDILEHFTKNFERMLSDNIDDYAENFQKYMQIGKSDADELHSH